MPVYLTATGHSYIEFRHHNPTTNDKNFYHDFKINNNKQDFFNSNSYHIIAVSFSNNKKHCYIFSFKPDKPHNYFFNRHHHHASK